VRLRIVYIVSESGDRFAFTFFVTEPEEVDSLDAAGIFFELAPHSDGELPEELPA
jgi:hypothetical protein